MAFAIKSYILVDIYCCNLPLQKLGGFKQNEDAQSDIRVWCISSSSIGSVYAIYLRRGRLCCLFLKGAAKAWILDKLIQRLRFFMDLSGNKELLDRSLVAFFASRNATPHDAQLAHQWAESICQTDKVVISGFHSPLEKEIMNYLLERHHPVIFALGRALYKKVPPHLQSAFDGGNLLFISFRGYMRHSWNSAQQRNWGIADLADEIYFTQFDNTSSLSTLHFTLDRYSDKAVYVLTHSN